jgi:gamma-glutamylcysteine synthetase
MGMLQANPLMAQNPDFMEDLMKSKQDEAQIQQAKREEEKKAADPELKYAERILDLMEST